jgi:hypothetical protein
VYLTYAGQVGHALIDRELYLPRSWTSDPARCAAAGVPDDVAFATKPELAQTMLARALEARCRRRGWPPMKSMAPTRECAPIWERARWVTCWPSAATAGCPRSRTDAPRRASRSPAQECLAAALGRPRCQGTALLRLGVGHPDRPSRISLAAHPSPPPPWRTRLLRCYSPTPVPLGELVRVAGRRWTIEENFQAAKGLAGLDEHQIRCWLAWRRWTLLAMLAHAQLAVITATEHT